MQSAGAPTGCEDHRVQTLDQYLAAYLAACLVAKQNSPEAEPLSCEHLVGVRRFELLTSSVSGKRSPPELNARSRVRKCARDNITEPELGGKNIFKNRLHCGIRGLCHIHFKRACCRDLTVA